MSASIDLRRLQSDQELKELAAIDGWSFGTSLEDSIAWLEQGGREHARVAADAGRVVGGLLLIPMGQWFGGRSVPTWGVAGVGVAPEHRGRKVALELMRAAVRECAAGGVALSTLYPATLTLYRAAGYAEAGSRFCYGARPADLAPRAERIPVRPLVEGEESRIDEAYSRFARRTSGYLDRGPYIWRRVRAPRLGPAPRAFLVEVDGAIEGYVYVGERSDGTGHYDLVVTDAVALTARAGRALLRLLWEHRSLGRTATWFGGPDHAFAALLPERSYTMALQDHWMVRICDVAAALAARDYAPGMRAELSLDLRDEIVENNSGRWRLEVDGGRATLRRGGDGELALDVRALAGLYTGFSSPWVLQRAGLLSGSDQVLSRAEAIFPGGSPAMADMF